MLTAVFFDFDGVIVDTEPLHYRAFQEVLSPIGLGYSWEEYIELFIGFDDRDALREAFRRGGRQLDPSSLPGLIEVKARAFNRIISSGVVPYPGVLEIIRSVKRNVPVALCSGALRCDIDPILEQLRLENVFDVIVTADDVPVSKPDPASYRLALRKMIAAFPDKGISAETSIAIEDTPAGVTSAKGAGMKVLAVTNSYPGERLAGADAVVSTLEKVEFRELCNVARR